MDYSSDSSSNYSNVSTAKSSGFSEDSIKSSPKTPISQEIKGFPCPPNKDCDVLNSADSKLTISTDYPKTTETAEIVNTESVSSIRNETTSNVFKIVKHKQGNNLKATIVKTQYEIYNILRGVNFCKHFIQKCRQVGVCGYVVFFNGRRNAFGEMEGIVKAINKIKYYLYSSCIPEPFTKRAKFSTYEREHCPKRIQFTRAYIVNKEEEGKENPTNIELEFGNLDSLKPENE